MSDDTKKCPVTHMTTDFGAPVVTNRDSLTAGPRGPLLAQDVWLNEKLAGFVREVIPERRMHAKGSGAFGTFTVTHDITKYTRAKIFSEVGKKTEMFARFTTVAGERGAADAERDIRGFALKFYTEEGNWDMVGNNTPVFFIRDPRQFPDLNKAVKRDPRTNLRSATNNWAPRITRSFQKIPPRNADHARIRFNFFGTSPPASAVSPRFCLESPRAAATRPISGVRKPRFRPSGDKPAASSCSRPPSSSS